MLRIRKIKTMKIKPWSQLCHDFTHKKNFHENFHVYGTSTKGVECTYGSNDVGGVQCDVLDPSRAVVLHVLFDLALPGAWGRLVDGHLDRPLEVGDHDGS